jgi:1-deoxy-D-xylulose-5-phosphate synthase
MSVTPGPVLAQIRTPQDLKSVKFQDLGTVCDELRTYIIEHVAQYGGHFGASLGVVELTVALHYTLNTPYDQLVWDVGHQAYGHKILTDRRERFFSNRVYKGLSGFPKRSESDYDTFGVGHSSTSISAALGMAVASRLKGEKDRQHVAVIGDGAMTAGLAFEALNHGGVEDTNLLVVLNDNCMSIDPNVGALKAYLTDITTSGTYNKMRDELWKLIGKVLGPQGQQSASKLEDGIKALLSRPGMLFEALGFRYFGPVDGHDVHHLARTLGDLKKIPGPKLLHCITVKGKGFAPAEKDQLKWHAQASPFDKVTGASLVQVVSKASSAPRYQDVFGITIVELARKNKTIIGITPAMPSGCSLNIMMREIPDRAFDVGIAEQHAVTFSAGLATAGMLPFCNIYSSFMQRAYDQVVHDVALQNLKVIFCLDRGGLAGADGPTHHGAFDLAYFRCIPNMIVSAPMNEQELRNLMFTATTHNVTGPFSIRYPRGNGVLSDWQTPFEAIEIGKGRRLRSGEKVAVLSIGHIGNYVAKALDQLEASGNYIGHYDLRFVKPLDHALLHEVFTSYEAILTVEDGCLQGGMGSAVLEFMADHGYAIPVKRLGIPDAFIEHGTQDELYTECGFDVNGIIEAVLGLTEKVLV